MTGFKDYVRQYLASIKAAVEGPTPDTSANDLAHIRAGIDSIILALAVANDRIIGEVVDGTPNGILTTFMVDNAFVANSETVYVNGLAMTRAVHYVPTGSASRIVFEAAYIPGIGDVIMMNYWKA